jgi:NAD+ diphosphatase
MSLAAFINTFAGSPLDRASDRRSDPDWIAGQLAAPDSLAAALWNGQPLVETVDGVLRLALLPAAFAERLSGGAERLLFLGLRDETAIFALDLEDAVDPTEGALEGLGVFANLRQAAAELPGGDSAMAAAAKSVFEWRRRHRHCAVCGEPTEPADGGWKRVCPACASEHFPRTDPVVIMLPFHGDRCMLGRQEAWPAGMFSALAGFLEPGECIEEACARELNEEAGLRTRTVRYHSSQPWPFPSSLMIGLIAEVEDDEAAPDQTELSEVRWFTRDEARELLAGRIEGLFTPPPLAIAHQLIKAWVEKT